MRADCARSMAVEWSRDQLEAGSQNGDGTGTVVLARKGSDCGLDEAGSLKLSLSDGVSLRTSRPDS